MLEQLEQRFLLDHEATSQNNSLTHVYRVKATESPTSFIQYKRLKPLTTKLDLLDSTTVDEKAMLLTNLFWIIDPSFSSIKETLGIPKEKATMYVDMLIDTTKIQQKEIEGKWNTFQKLLKKNKIDTVLELYEAGWKVHEISVLLGELNTSQIYTILRNQNHTNT